MRIEWIQAARRPNWPWWAIFLPMLWLTLGGVLLLLTAHTGWTPPLCLFKHLTGCPCPSCGFTRGALAFLHGHPVQAWLYNPLLFSVLGGFAALAVVQGVLGKSPRVSLTHTERATAWAILAILFAANWLYVICCIG